MKRTTNPLLDPTKAIDIVKYALAIGDPLQPAVVPDLLRALLKGKAATYGNKIEALCTKGVTQRFLDDKWAKVMHPEMSNYTKIVLRVRAVNGFHEFLSLHHDINEELGRKKGCRISNSL